MRLWILNITVLGVAYTWLAVSGARGAATARSAR